MFHTHSLSMYIYIGNSNNDEYCIDMTILEIKQQIYSVFNDVIVLIDQISSLSTNTNINDIDISSLGIIINPNRFFSNNICVYNSFIYSFLSIFF